jgi:CO dehydrogenase flavoprotein C-terminal domain
MRRAQDWATVGVAAVVRRSNGTIENRAIALTNMSPTPLRARAAEETLRTPDDVGAAAQVIAEGSDPPSDTSGSAEYRRHLATARGGPATVDGIEIVPDPPQTPLFHILLRGDRKRLADAALSLAEERKVFLFADPSSTTTPSWQRHEVMVGEVTLLLRPGEVAISTQRSWCGPPERDSQIVTAKPRPDSNRRNPLTGPTMRTARGESTGCLR